MSGLEGYDLGFEVLLVQLLARRDARVDDVVSLVFGLRCLRGAAGALCFRAAFFFGGEGGGSGGGGPPTSQRAVRNDRSANARTRRSVLGGRGTATDAPSWIGM